MITRTQLNPSVSPPPLSQMYWTAKFQVIWSIHLFWAVPRFQISSFQGNLYYQIICLWCTVGQNNEKYRQKYWATRSSVRSWESEFFMSQNDLVLSHSALWARTTKNTDEVLGHSLVRSLDRSHRSLVCSLRTTLLARSAALTRSLARSLRSLPRSWERGFLYEMNASPAYNFHPLWVSEKIEL